MKTVFLFIMMIGLSSGTLAQTAVESIAKGNRYYLMESYDLAEVQYRKALETDPKNTTAQYNLANALQKQKKYNESIQILENLGVNAPDKQFRSVAFYNQGVAHTKQKNLEASIESYKKSLRLNPEDEWARENLQKALQEQKKNQQQQNQQKKKDQKMSQNEAEQKLKLLQQKEKNLQQRLKDKNKQQGSGQAQDW